MITRRDFAAAIAALPVVAQAQTKAPGAGTNWVKSVCRYCGTGCGLYIGVERGRVIAVRGDIQNHNAGFLCLKGAALPEVLYGPDRLLHPLIRRNDAFARASWEDAMALVAGKFREAIDRYGPDAVAFYGSGQATTEESYIANKLFKAGIRTNNVDGNPRLCMASATAGYISTYGKDEPMGCYEDIDHADVFLLIGSNTAEAHPIIFRRILERKRRAPDTKVIIIDPRRTPTARIADLHLQIIPGTDLAVLNAMAHALVRDGLVDDGFIANHVAFGEGTEANKKFDDYWAFLAGYTPKAAAKTAGVSAPDIELAARMFGARGRAAMSMWTMGLNQRIRGVWVNNLVHNLHLITGKIGTPGSTPLSLTGQPNACGGVRDGGALSHLLPYGRLIANEKHREEMEQLWGVPKGTIQAKPGPAAVEMFQALESGAIKAMFIMTTNPGQSLPNVERYRKAMRRNGAFLVVADAFHPTRTTELADVVLPAALWAEKEGVYGCTERRYQLMERAVDPQGESRPDLAILRDFAQRLGHGKLIPFITPAEVWDEILKTAKGTAYDFSGMTRERLRQAHGLLWPLPAPGHPGTRRRYVRGEDPLVPADHPERVLF
jgi:nitrate reductase NapA